jgi:hypothetical protein
MKLRTIGAVLAGAAMIGATVAGAAAAAQVPAKSWWIDPATGAPNVVIAVGAQANASDVVSASLIAAAVGNMATVEESASVPKSATATFDKMFAYNYSHTTQTEAYDVYCTARQATWYTDYDLYSFQFWETSYDNWPSADYDIDVALAFPAEVRNPGASGPVVAKGLSTLWFSNSVKEWDSKDRVYYFAYTSATGAARKYYLVNVKTANAVDPTYTIAKTLPPYAGGSYDDADGSFDFDGYAFFTTRAWVDVAGNANAFNTTVDCDYLFGGTGTAMEAHEEIQVIPSNKYAADPGYNDIVDFIGDKGSISGIVYRTAEIRYPLLENGQNICGVTNCDGMVDFETARKGYLNEIKFLGKMYKPMFAGATYRTGSPDSWYLGAYFMYGKPYAEKEKIMKVGDVYSFHGWTVTLNDVNIYENKAYITVSGPALTTPFTFIMVMDSLGDCGPCCPECAAYGGGGSFTSNPTRRNEYDPYVVKTTVSKEKSGYTYDFFRYVNFVLDGIKTFVGADGTYLAEFNLYAIEDYGYLEDKGCCDPFVTTPNDYGLAITGGWRKVAYNAAPYDISTVGTLKNATPATGHYDAWEQYAGGLGNEFNSSFILWRPAPKCDAMCPDANFDTLELQLCDNIIVPNCETSYTINGPENYFTVQIDDVNYGKNLLSTYGYIAEEGIFTGAVAPVPFFTAYAAYPYDTADSDNDGLKIVIKQTTTGDTIKYTANVKIDPVELIKLDIEINTATNTKNLVLVGGPVYNSIVKDLVDMGASTVDWATSAGEWEWIADPMAKGYDVLIVAGANREETRMAAEDLVAMLN